MAFPTRKFKFPQVCSENDMFDSINMFGWISWYLLLKKYENVHPLFINCLSWGSPYLWPTVFYEKHQPSLTLWPGDAIKVIPLSEVPTWTPSHCVWEESHTWAASSAPLQIAQMVNTRIEASSVSELKIEIISNMLASKLKLQHLPSYFSGWLLTF